MNNDTISCTNIDVKLTEKDYDYFTRLYIRETHIHPLRGYRLLWRMMGFLAIISGILLVYNESLPLVIEDVFCALTEIMMAVFSIAMYLYGCVFMRLRLLKRSMRDSCFVSFDPLMTEAHGQMRFSFGKSGFSLSGGGETMIFNYGEVERVIETRRGLLIVFEESKFLFLPARAFCADTAFKTYQTLNEAMQGFYIRRRLMYVPAEPERAEVSFIPRQITDEVLFSASYTPSFEECRAASSKRHRLPLTAMLFFVSVSMTVVGLILVGKFTLMMTYIYLMAYVVITTVYVLLSSNKGKRLYKKYYNGLNIQFDEKKLAITSFKTGKTVCRGYDEIKRHYADADLILVFKDECLMLPFRMMGDKRIVIKK